MLQTLGSLHGQPIPTWQVAKEQPEMLTPAVIEFLLFCSWVRGIR